MTSRGIGRRLISARQSRRARPVPHEVLALLARADLAMVHAAKRLLALGVWCHCPRACNTSMDKHVEGREKILYSQIYNGLVRESGLSIPMGCYRDLPAHLESFPFLPRKPVLVGSGRMGTWAWPRELPTCALVVEIHNKGCQQVCTSTTYYLVILVDPRPVDIAYSFVHTSTSILTTTDYLLVHTYLAGT